MPKEHQLLGKLGQYKNESNKKIEQLTEEDKLEMLKLEHAPVLANERLRTLKQILTQHVTYFKLDSVKRALTGNFNKATFNTIRNYLLGSYWL